jgi:hypothetical protein
MKNELSIFLLEFELALSLKSAFIFRKKETIKRPLIVSFRHAQKY